MAFYGHYSVSDRLGNQLVVCFTEEPQHHLSERKETAKPGCSCCHQVMSMRGVSKYHFLGNLLGNVLVEIKQKFNGIVIFVFAMKLLVVVHPEPELQSRFGSVVILGQIHVDPQLFLEEPVIKQVLDREPAAGNRQ